MLCSDHSVIAISLVDSNSFKTYRIASHLNPTRGCGACVRGCSRWLVCLWCCPLQIHRFLILCFGASTCHAPHLWIPTYVKTLRPATAPHLWLSMAFWYVVSVHILATAPHLCIPLHVKVYRPASMLCCTYECHYVFSGLPTEISSVALKQSYMGC